MPGVIEEELRSLAKKQGAVQESVACKGTPLESITFTRDEKAFLFVMRRNGLNVVRLKVVDSEDEAKKLALQDPTHYELGANGWAKLTFGDEIVPRKILERWIAESYDVFGPQPEKKSAPARRAAKTSRKPAKRAKPKSKAKAKKK